MQRGVPVLIQSAAAVGLHWECEKASVFQKFVEVRVKEKVFFFSSILCISHSPHLSVVSTVIP